MELKIIARIKTDFPTKFGVPRQSGMCPLESVIVFEKEYGREEALRGLEYFEYIWLIWGFDRTEKPKWSPTVRPPRLGGNKRMGVFATRSPYRPNPLALSSVKIVSINKNGTITVTGADIADGSPIYDIKPYLPFTDAHPNAKAGFSEQGLNHRLTVKTDEADICEEFPKEKLSTLVDVLQLDPRPSYQEDGRIYGFKFAKFEVKFVVSGQVIKLISIQN